ncbi:hypothetical protein [Aquimarina pacifica]|uniref:hypothetical protein n=1 Tax=Aquimarina pacifica TaxID=1296415 RepID=UPI00046E976C|nr:hypothetical protein [Aquimarina pacifica]
MIKNLITYLLITLLGVVSCKKKEVLSENGDSKKVINQEITDSSKIRETKNQIIDTVQKISKTPKNLKSHLKSKVERLSKLENNYVLKEIGLIKIEKTRLIGGLERLVQSEFEKPKEIENINVDKIKNLIYESRFSFLKATKSMSPEGNTYPRAKVEEYIFNNIDEAVEIFEFLKKLQKNDRYWIMIAKEPHSMFLEENRLYFISSGGWYMMNMYKEIENEIKKRP